MTTVSINRSKPRKTVDPVHRHPANAPGVMCVLQCACPTPVGVSLLHTKRQAAPRFACFFRLKTERAPVTRGGLVLYLPSADTRTRTTSPRPTTVRCTTYRHRAALRSSAPLLRPLSRRYLAAIIRWRCSRAGATAWPRWACWRCSWAPSAGSCSRPGCRRRAARRRSGSACAARTRPSRTICVPAGSGLGEEIRRDTGPGPGRGSGQGAG